MASLSCSPLRLKLCWFLCLIAVFYTFGFHESIASIVYHDAKMKTPFNKSPAPVSGLRHPKPTQSTKKNVMVTGVAGYVGSHTALMLLERGYRVVGIDNMSRGSQVAVDVLNEFPSFVFERVDLGDKASVEDLFSRIRLDAVMHFADKDFVTESVYFPELYQTTIVNKARILVDTMIRHEVSPLLYSSSCDVYGFAEHLPITDNTPTEPRSQYGRAKLDAENYILSRTSTTFQAHALRFFNVVGADAKGRLGENPHPELVIYGRLWTACIEVVFRRRPCVQLHDSQLDTPDGSVVRDYVHVEDVARAHLNVLEQKNNTHQVYNVAGNIRASTLEFVETARQVTGIFLPVCFGNRSEPSEFEAPELYKSAAALRSIGWRPRYESLEDIISTAWGWTNQTLHTCPTLADDLETTLELASLPAGKNKGVVFTTVTIDEDSRSHVEWVSNWYSQLRYVGVPHPIVFGIDSSGETCERVTALGMCCRSFDPQDFRFTEIPKLIDKRDNLSPASVDFKWVYAQELLSRAFRISFSEDDVHWFRYPFLEHFEEDIRGLSDDRSASDLDDGWTSPSCGFWYGSPCMSTGLWDIYPSNRSIDFAGGIVRDLRTTNVSEQEIANRHLRLTQDTDSSLTFRLFPKSTHANIGVWDKRRESSMSLDLSAVHLGYVYGEDKKLDYEARGLWAPSFPINRPLDWTSRTFDVCIVGAGLSGSVLAERHASTFNHSVLIVEKRNHVGGNCYDYIDKETGIRVSKYGVHLFHTRHEQVWRYMQQFSRWNKWEHRVLAKIDKEYVPVPVNIDTVNALFNTTISSEKEMKRWLKKIQIPSGNATNSEEVALERVGPRLYDLIFKPYTMKQWNKTPAELGPSVLARIPVRTNFDSRYFTDPYQYLPSDGYTRIFENMLSSSKITVKLNTDYFTVKDSMNCGHTYFTGPIDAYFAAQNLPKLEYRSLEFERRVYHNTDYFQPRSQVNYPSLSYNYTRSIEYKHLLHQKSNHTVVFFEHSTDHGDPYYPVPNQENQDLYAKYQLMAEEEEDVTFVGRLANYKYFNMDETVLNSLNLFETFCSPGIFSSVDQWTSLFPRGKRSFNLTGQAMIAIPVGGRSSDAMDLMVKRLGTTNYHFTFITYDNFNWKEMEWFDEVEWLAQPPNSGTGWAMAKRFLTPKKVSTYSHVCFWDDDLVVTDEFDGDVFLQWLQKLNLEISQPMIRKNPHTHLEGLSTEHRSNITHVHEVETVEVMAPCYSGDVWSSCIWPNLEANFSTGWGVDFFVSHAQCAPPSQYSVRLPLDHNDTQSLPKPTAYSELEFYKMIASEKGWGAGSESRRSFQVSLDGSCRLSMQPVGMP